MVWMVLVVLVKWFDDGSCTDADGNVSNCDDDGDCVKMM